MTTEARLRIVTSVRGDATQRLQSMDRMLRGIDRTQSRALRSAAALGRGAGRAWGMFERHLFNVRTLAIGLTGVAAGAGSLVALAKNVADVGDASIKSARRVQMGVEAYQELRYAAEQTGVAEGTLQSMISFNQKSVGEAVRGSKSLQKVYKELGLNVRELSTLKPADLFERVAGAVRGIEDPTKRAALASQTLGRGWSQAASLIEADIGGLRKESQKFGFIIPEEAALKAEEFNDSINRMKLRITGVKNQLGLAVLPVIQRIIHSTEKWFDANRKAFTLNPKLKSDLDRVGELVGRLVNHGLELATHLPAGMEKVVQTIERLRSLGSDMVAFYNRHETFVKVAAGGYVANRMTGGALGRGALAGGGAIVRAVASRGRSGVGAASGVIGGLQAANATPVYVVNAAEIGMGGVGGGIGSVGKAAGTGAIGKGLAGAGMGAGLVGGGLIAAFAGAAATFAYSSKLTSRNLQIAENLGKKPQESASAKEARLQADMDAKERADRNEELVKATGNVRSMLDAAMLTQDQELRAENLRTIAMESTASIHSSSDKSGMMEALGQQLGMDVSFDKRTKQARFGVDESLLREMKKLESDREYMAIAGQRSGATGGEAQLQEQMRAVHEKIIQNEAVAQELNKVKIDKQEIHLHVQNFGGTRREAQDAAKMMGDAIGKKIGELE